MACDGCAEKKGIERAAESSRLMGDMVQMYDRQNKRLWVALLACVACLVIMSGCMIWTVQNAERADPPPYARAHAGRSGGRNVLHGQWIAEVGVCSARKMPSSMGKFGVCARNFENRSMMGGF